MQSPLYKSLAEYRDKPEPGAQQAFNQVWNTVQKDVSIEHCIFMEKTVFCLLQLRCCGVRGARDWTTNVTAAGWDPAGANKPVFCCPRVFLNTLFELIVKRRRFCSYCPLQGGCCAWERTTDSGAVATKDSASLVSRNGFLKLLTTPLQQCRRTIYSVESAALYYWEGCLSRYY